MSSSPKSQAFTAPKGMHEYVPPQSRDFIAVRDTFTRQAYCAGYEHIELPIVEETALFARGVGESTDVVTKEMYTFEDRSGRSLTLRPEGTAGVIRATIEHHLDQGQLPVKLVYSGPFFRYERPQAGRYRQLQQVGVEAIGIDDPLLDAEVIALAHRCFTAIGLTGYRLDITSLGDETCRPRYREALQSFLKALPLDEETRRRAEINPLRVLDDKRPEVQEMVREAPLLLDFLSPSARDHFTTVTSVLDDWGIPYVINPWLVRGLDYYTKTCFEFVHEGLGAQSGIGGGGRYDGLMAQLGGSPLSGVGYGLGVDRALLAVEHEQRVVAANNRVDVYGVPMGDRAARDIAGIIHRLRKAGIRADMSYGGRGLKGAMKGAARAGARWAVIMGESELNAGVVTLKNMDTQEQQECAVEELERIVRDTV